MHWIRRAMTGQRKAGRVTALLVALLWALLPLTGATGVSAAGAQWVAVPYCAAQPSSAAGGEQPPAPQRTWLYLVPAGMLPGSGNLAAVLPPADIALPPSAPRGVLRPAPHARPIARDCRVALPAVRGPPAFELLLA